MLRNALLVFLLICYGLDPVVSQKAYNFTNELVPGDPNKLNAILFLPHTDYNSNYEHDNGITFLNVSLVGRIQPCTTRPESTLPLTMESIIRPSPKHKCDCKKLLGSSISSLVGWARNVMGMTAAIVSLNSDQKDQKKVNTVSYYDYKLEIVDSPLLHKTLSKQVSERMPLHTINMQTMRDFQQLPLPPNDNVQVSSLPVLVKDNRLSSQRIPIFNTYLRQPVLQFNNIHKYHRNKFKNLANVHRIKRKLIIEPENTEIINIQAMMNEEPNEILDIPALKRAERPESIWDLLGIMSAIRKSFFANFLNPVLDPQQRMLDEESGTNFNSLGQVRAPSLFHLVKGTLHRLQRETNFNNRSGYLLIVFGGSLSHIADPYSDLVQSVKHIRETTNPRSTLLVVTGHCPTNSTEAEGLQGIKERNNMQLPVYATGPNHELLSKAHELFDIPIQIKNALKGNRNDLNSNLNEKNTGLVTPTFSGVLNVANEDLSQNDFNKEWLEKIQNVNNENPLETTKVWDNNRFKRNARELLPELFTNKSVGKEWNKFIFIVIASLLFTV